MSRPEAGPAAPARWRLRLLGGIAASGASERIERFGNGSVAALAARLALYPGRSHGREELIELLWPGADLAAGRNRLRQTLFALRALLEPPGPMPRPVLVADRARIGVVAGALECDAVEFERAARAGRHAEALALYAGELMPGHYAEWIDDERRRLAALAERAAALAPGDLGASPRPAPAAGGAPAAARRDRSPLPLYLTRFFGREAEGARLRDALAVHRLVSLLGPGGCGKTRLATETCAGLRAAGAAGRLLIFVPLVGCSSRAGLIDGLAGALQLATGGDDALARVVEALEARPALLVLDNFEQLVEAAGDVVARLAATLPELHLLVTSRRALGLDGEHCVGLAPLPLPAAAAPLREAAASDALGLFVDRARAVRADFHLSERNLGVLTALVRALDGLPLALELAASRVRAIAPAEMLDHLRPPAGRPRSGLALLARSGVRAGHDPRHASMLRTIEWSWRLLSASQQRFLAGLTVFEGGFTAAAAAAVAEAGDVPAIVRLDELVAHSLLSVQRLEDDDEAGPDSAATRFALDESIREYAAATLDEARARSGRARHRHWLAAWGAGLPPTPPLAALRAESRNLGAALASALADGAPAEGVAAMVALRRGLADTAVPATQLCALAEALEACTDAGLASRGHSLLARLHLAAASIEPARAHAARGLALARETHIAGAGAGNAELLGRALQVAASVSWRTARDAGASEALLDEAAAPIAAAGDLGLIASALALRAFIANVAHRDLARAERLHAEALASWLREGDAVAANTGRYNLAVCALRARRFGEVLERLAEVKAEAERRHDWRLLSQAHNVAGEAHAGRREWAAAGAAYRASLELAWNAFARVSFGFALWNLPLALAHARDAARAAELAGAAEQFWLAHLGGLDANDHRDLARVRRLVRVQIGAGAADALWRAGRQRPLQEVVALALGPGVAPLPAAAA